MPLPTNATLTVHCLCAAWCGVCRDYRHTFNDVAREAPEAQFGWVDVEDHAELVEPVEIENFPTLLISRAGRPLFFGTVTPHAATLRRLVKSCAEGPELVDPQALALVQRLLRAPSA